MVKTKIILIASLIFSSVFGFSETSNYEITLAGFKIGTLSATHVKVKNIDYYSIVSNVSVNLLFKVQVYYKTVSVYRDDKLIESKVNSLVNGKNFISNTVWDGKKYKINCNTYKYTYSDSSRIEPIKWSVSKLYFERPTSGTEVYAETYGRLSALKLERENQFRFEIPKSKQIYYYSKDGYLTEVEMINSVKNFKVTKST
jgi:hypothetical protein